MAARNQRAPCRNMELKISCPGCSRIISGTDGRLPPWCPNCGADLKGKVDQRPTPGTTSVPPQFTSKTFGSEIAPAGASRFPYFHGSDPSFSSEDHRLYRLYIT